MRHKTNLPYTGLRKKVKWKNGRKNGKHKYSFYVLSCTEHHYYDSGTQGTQNLMIC